MKAVEAAFNQEKALVGAFSVITNLWMELFEALLPTPTPCCHVTSSVYHQSYTDYSLVNQYWHWGHEMAAHSITHRNNQTYWQTMSPQEWRDEMVGVRRMIAQAWPAFTPHLDTCPLDRDEAPEHFFSTHGN